MKEKELSDFLRENEKLFNDGTINDIEKRKGNYNEVDDRFIYPKTDEKGTGYLDIRFMPTGNIKEKVENIKSEGGKVSDIQNWVEVLEHYYENENGTYLREYCPKMFKKPCPICENLKPYWNGSDAEKNIARQKGPKRKYIYNIYVVNYPLEPEHNGKVFLWSTNRKIHNKILKHMPDTTKGEKIGDCNSSGDLIFNAFFPFTSPIFRIKLEKDEFPARGKKVQFTSVVNSDFREEVKPMEDAEFNKAYKDCYDVDELLREYKIKKYAELAELYKSGDKEIDFEDIPQKSIVDEKEIQDAFKEKDEDEKEIDDLVNIDNNANITMEDIFDD